MDEALTFLSSPESSTVPGCLGMALRVGEVNMKVMELLSNAHRSNFGSPTPTVVSMTPRPGKAILITGHDMHDMSQLLEQTQGTGINVYTHGEMLPAHGYPGLKKHAHLAGNYGGAWYRQKSDFARFPGAIVVTTNCVLDPLDSYKDNMFTLNEVNSALLYAGSRVSSLFLKAVSQMHHALFRSLRPAWPTRSTSAAQRTSPLSSRGHWRCPASPRPTSGPPRRRTPTP